MGIVTAKDGYAILDEVGRGISDQAIVATAYLEMLQALLPIGPAWTREPSATLTDLLDAFAAELSRVHGRGQDILDEADPGTTSELLEEWEEMVGLPEDCAELAGTEDERRDAVVAKLVARGGQSRQYFIDLAAELGIDITISEYHDPFTVGSCAGDSLYSSEWCFAWKVTTPSTDLDELLECMITKRKPAHTAVIFDFTT